MYKRKTNKYFSNVARNFSWLNKMIEQAEKQKRYYEAALLQFSLVELLLRILIMYQLIADGRAQSEALELVNEEKVSLLDLMNYADLVTHVADQNFLRSIRIYNAQRNRIVHDILHYKNSRSFLKDAKDNFLRGQSLEKVLVKKIVKIKE